MHSFVFIGCLPCSVSIFIISTGQRSPISKWWTGTKDYHQLICHNNWVHFHIRYMHLSFKVIWFGNLAASFVIYANVSKNTLVCLWGIRIHIGIHTGSIFHFWRREKFFSSQGVSPTSYVLFSYCFPKVVSLSGAWWVAREPIIQTGVLTPVYGWITLTCMKLQLWEGIVNIHPKLSGAFASAGYSQRPLICLFPCNPIHSPGCTGCTMKISAVRKRK